jgi:peptide/nickel transport system permease protein
MLTFLVKRVLWGVGTLILTAFFAFGMIRLLRPELYGGESVITGTWMDVKEALLHLTIDGDPSYREDWKDGMWPDLFLLAGGALVAVVVGVSAGLWCAVRRRQPSARGIESSAMFLLCAPPYVLALGTLLLFAPPFGLVQLPYFFDPHSYAPPLQNPWDFFRSMLVPCLLVGLPLAASMMRLTLALTVDAMGEEWVRTAEAKGLPHGRVVRKHAAPSAFPTVASLFGASAPILVLNIVLVEYVFSVPGFFRHMRHALGQGEGLSDKFADIPMLQAIALWAAVLIVALSLIGDLAIMRYDPRIRTSGKAIG